MTGRHIDFSALTFGPRKLDESREYKCWSNMKTRCLNPKNNRYHMYGGRGISICPEWVNSFETFFADMGPCGAMSIERINVNGNYEPGNCKWATDKEQQNNKTSTRKIRAFGEERTLSGWSEYFGIDPSLLHYHLKCGKTIEEFAKERIPIEKICENCGAIFETLETHKSQQKYCDSECKNTARSRRRVDTYRRKTNNMPIISKITEEGKLYVRLYGKKEDGTWRRVQWYSDIMLATKFSEEESIKVARVLGTIAVVEKS